MNRDEFIAAILANPVNRTILDRLPQLDLSDAWLVSGALFQTVWNVLTGRDPGYGIKDYDIFYFDPDTSYDAEDRAIEKAQALFADLAVEVEVRNQARLHLWYQEKFGAPYPSLHRACDGIDRFLSHNSQVGIQVRREGYAVYAPSGFDDIVAMKIRPNRVGNFQEERFAEKATRWKERWPELTILSS